MGDWEAGNCACDEVAQVGACIATPADLVVEAVAFADFGGVTGDSAFYGDEGPPHYQDNEGANYEF